MTKRMKIVSGLIVVVVLIVLGVFGARMYEERELASVSDTYYPPSAGASSGIADSVAVGLSARPPLFGSRKRAAPSAPPAAGAEAPQANRLIIKTASLSLVARDVPQAVARVTALVEQAEGFVVESSLSDATTRPRASMRVRVPVEGLDGFLEQARAIATRVVSESVRGEDVTEEYVDVQAQLRNLKASEEQFLQILTRAGTIADVLNVQQQLERVRGEIERAEGRKKYLEQSAAMSTVQLYIAAEEEELPTLNPQQKWRPKAVWKASVRSLILTAQGLANAAIRLAVLAPIWLPIALIAWWLWRRYRRRAAARKPPTTA